MKCPACDSEFKSYTAISLHYRNKHGSAAQFREIMRQKYVDENHGGITPTCKCGCGAIPKYYDYERGYVEFVKGHHARIHNNWGHNEAALQKSQDKRREQIAAGEWTPWNKGETKTTDERVAAYGKTGHIRSKLILTVKNNVLNTWLNSGKQDRSRRSRGLLTPNGKAAFHLSNSSSVPTCSVSGQDQSWSEIVSRARSVVSRVTSVFTMIKRDLLQFSRRPCTTSRYLTLRN